MSSLGSLGQSFYNAILEQEDIWARRSLITGSVESHTNNVANVNFGRSVVPAQLQSSAHLGIGEVISVSSTSSGLIGRGNSTVGL